MFRFWHDKTGSVLVEYTVVFPLFILVTLGAVDVAYMLSEWDLANKAAYVGARTAAISNPVAQNITDPTTLNYDPSLDGQPCYNFSTGTSTGNCPSIPLVTCTSTACTPNTYGFDGTAFTGIFGPMQNRFPRLQPENVTISYQGNGSGFSGRSNGLPMNITVSITGMTHQFFFVPSILKFFGGSILTTPPIPAFSTTMQSEDMVTN